MADLNQKISYGLIGLLFTIVATMGGTMFLTPDQLDNAYICSINQNVVIADHLSSTSKTAYWIDELNETQSQVCRNGYWLNLKQYAEDNDLDINILLQNGFNEEIPINNTPINYTSNTQGNEKYSCDQIKCTRI